MQCTLRGILMILDILIVLRKPLTLISIFTLVLTTVFFILMFTTHHVNA